MIFCPNCGKQIGQIGKFCPNCGTALSDLSVPKNIDNAQTGESILWVDRIDKYLISEQQNTSTNPVVKYLMNVLDVKYEDELILDVIFTDSHFYLRPTGKAGHNLASLAGTLFLGGTFGMWDEINKRITSKIVSKSRDLETLAILPNELSKTMPRWRYQDLIQVQQSLPSWGKRAITTFKFTGICELQEKNYENISIFFILAGSASPSKNQNITFSIIAPFLKKTLDDVTKI